MEEFANRESHRLWLRLYGTVTVPLFAASVGLTVGAILFPQVANRFGPIYLVPVLGLLLGLSGPLRPVPRDVLLGQGFFVFRYSVGKLSVGIPAIRGAISFDAPWPYRQPSGAESPRLLHVYLVGGVTKVIGVLDGPVANRVIEEIARQGCPVMVFPQQARSREEWAGGMHPSSRQRSGP